MKSLLRREQFIKVIGSIEEAARERGEKEREPIQKELNYLKQSQGLARPALALWGTGRHIAMRPCDRSSIEPPGKNL